MHPFSDVKHVYDPETLKIMGGYCVAVIPSRSERS